MPTLVPEALGSPDFRRDYGLRYAYVAGAMYKGISSREMVVAMGKAGMLAFLGTGGLSDEEVDRALDHIKTQLPRDKHFGMNLLCDLERPDLEIRTVEKFLRSGVQNVEAAAYLHVTPALVRWRTSGLRLRPDGSIHAPHRVLAKVSRPEVALAFLGPPPAGIVRDLLVARVITQTEAELSSHIAMADDICVESDSGGHTDGGVAFALLPAILELRSDLMRKYKYAKQVRVGAAGGIGVPQAAAAAFVMGADFVLTGSINQCTVEAGTSDAVKSILQDLSVQDTAYAPAGDMFELGAKVQVVRKGNFFAARANKLYDLYQRHESLEQIDAKTRAQVERRYFQRSFEEVWEETREYLQRNRPEALDEVERNPKRKMALVFKWYFVNSTRLAMRGDEHHKVDFQIHCGPAMGAFNQWVRGTALQDWRNRKVADIGMRMMTAAADWLQDQLTRIEFSNRS